MKTVIFFYICKVRYAFNWQKFYGVSTTVCRRKINPICFHIQSNAFAMLRTNKFREYFFIANNGCSRWHRWQVNVRRNRFFGANCLPLINYFWYYLFFICSNLRSDTGIYTYLIWRRFQFIICCFCCFRFDFPASIIPRRRSNDYICYFYRSLYPTTYADHIHLFGTKCNQKRYKNYIRLCGNNRISFFGFRTICL